MIEKRNFFNFTKVPFAEYEEYKKKGFLVDEHKIEKNIYHIALIIFIIYGIISLYLFYKLRKSYIIRQRHFMLTFVGGIATFINIIIGFLPQLIPVPCSLTLFSANIMNTFINLVFLMRSFRIILNYHLNLFKVSTINKKRKFHDNNNMHDGIVDPNSYLLKMSKKINRIIISIIIIPTLIALIATMILYGTDYENMNKSCPLFQAEDSLISLKENKAERVYIIVIIFGGIFIVSNLATAIALMYVKDSNKYGIKFECLSVSILVFLCSIFNIILQKLAFPKANEKAWKFILNVFEATKGGKMVFTVVSIYMFFISITLPVISYFKAKKLKNKYFQDPMNSLQYFYKVLNTPALINELKKIAIKEFSVENVLFWENYQLLKKMVYCYQLEYNKAIEMGDERLVSQYDFEGYYQQIQNYSTSSQDNYVYDPSMLIPKEIMPYYMSFYHMFIDFNGPAVVNISSRTIKKIFNEICIYPTVGIYDDAVQEVVELMYYSLYPILLKQNKEHMANTLS